MPLYEYRCERCGATFEKLVPLAERDAGQRCPKCSSNRVKRLISTFSVGGRESASESTCPTCTTGTCTLR